MRRPNQEPSPEELHDAEQEMRRLLSHAPAQTFKLLKRMRNEIRDRAYDALLGDDGKGRIPTLILGQALQELYGEKKRLQLAFVAGGSILRDSGTTPDPDEATHAQEVLRYLIRMKPVLGKRVLIVTEEIGSGRSMGRLAEILRSIGIECDIATFGMVLGMETAEEPAEAEDGPPYEPRTYTDDWGNRVLVGDYENGPILDSRYSGLVRAARSGFGHAVRRTPVHALDRFRERRVRELAKLIGHAAAERFRRET